MYDSNKIDEIIRRLDAQIAHNAEALSRPIEQRDDMPVNNVRLCGGCGLLCPRHGDPRDTSVASPSDAVREAQR